MHDAEVYPHVYYMLFFSISDRFRSRAPGEVAGEYLLPSQLERVQVPPQPARLVKHLPVPVPTADR